jgi:hypothetical protein
MVRAVEAQASQDRMQAMDAARRDVMQSYEDEERWSGDPEPLDEEWPEHEPR